MRDFTAIAIKLVAMRGSDILYYPEYGLVQAANWLIENGRISGEATISEASGSALAEAVRVAVANRDAVLKSEKETMPSLEGSERQVLWAEEIRDAAITRAQEKQRGYVRDGKDRSADMMELYIQSKLRRDRRAKWFIDNRNDLNSAWFITAVLRSLQPKEHVDPSPETDAERDAKAEMMLRPEQEAHVGYAEVIVSADEVRGVYAKDEDFQEIVRAMRMRWDKVRGCWVKAIDAITGTAEDRGAELAARLLDRGFTVMVSSDEVRRKVRESDWEPEHRRWVYRRNDGKLCVTFERSDKIYGVVRRALRGAAWDADCGGFVIDASRHEELGELTRLYDFRITEGAREGISAYEAVRAQAAVVNPEVRKKQYDAPGVASILKSSDEVLPDLRDE